MKLCLNLENAHVTIMNKFERKGGFAKGWKSKKLIE